MQDAFCSLAEIKCLDPQYLAAEMAEARPDVMAAKSAIAAARANWDLSRAARIQDVQAGPIYETADDGTHYLGLRLQRDFGVFNNGSALATQRQTEMEQQVLAYNQLKIRATNDVTTAIDRYERARRYVAESLREGQASPPQELDQVLRQYEAGLTEVLSVLTIQNNLLLEQRAQLDLLNELAQAAAVLTQATGFPPARLMEAARRAATATGAAGVSTTSWLAIKSSGSSTPRHTAQA